MVLQYDRLVAGNAVQCFTNFDARFAPIGTEVLDEVNRAVCLTCFVFHATHRHQGYIQQGTFHRGRLGSCLVG